MSVPNPATVDWVPIFAGGGGLTYGGDWSAATTYKDGDVVIKDGVAFICVGGPTTVPPDVLVWGLASTAALIGTNLPGSPVDGQEFILVDSVTAPTYQWRLRYVAAKASNKWIFIGGAPAVVLTAASETTAQTGTYADMTTPGPDFTIPVAGDYQITMGYNGSNTAAGGVQWMSYAVGATAPSDNDAVLCQISTSGGQFGADRMSVKTAIPAATLLRVKYKVSGGTGTFANRRLIVQPRAVGG